MSFQLSPDLLPSQDRVPAFSEVGVGGILAASFRSNLLSEQAGFPFTTRGRTLLLVADFGGEHRRQHFDTYTFLVLDIAKNRKWIEWQRHFRDTNLQNHRRMSFKALNDGMRRRALVPFMKAAAGIEGCLVQFAVSKLGGSLFTRAPEDNAHEQLLKRWKPEVRERLLRVLHFASFLLSGLSFPDQDVLFVVDEDNIAANTPMLKDMTKVFERILSNYISHTLRHVRCGTAATAGDDGLVLEDLAAIADLTTGALSELCTGFINENMFPRNGLITPLPVGLTWKTKLIASWMGAPEFAIRRHTMILKLHSDSNKIDTLALKWKTYEGSLVVPS